MNNHSKVMQEHGKSFFWASWFLDKNTANKLFAVYAFCRRLDDLVDTSNRNSEAKEEIARVISLTKNSQYKQTFEEFKSLDSKLHPRQDIIIEFLKGQLSDLDFRQPNDLGQLLKYCYRVAGVVGLMICDVLDIHDSKLRYFAIDFGSKVFLTSPSVYIPSALISTASKAIVLILSSLSDLVILLSLKTFNASSTTSEIKVFGSEL